MIFKFQMLPVAVETSQRDCVQRSLKLIDASILSWEMWTMTQNIAAYWVS